MSDYWVYVQALLLCQIGLDALCHVVFDIVVINLVFVFVASMGFSRQEALGADGVQLSRGPATML